MRKFLVALMMIAPAPLFADLYDCVIDKASDREWISNRIIINHDPTTGRVLVSDSTILMLRGAPVEGSVKTDNAKRRTFKWAIKDIRAGTQHAPALQFTGTVQKASGKAMITMTPVGYANTFQRYGKCAVTK